MTRRVELPDGQWAELRDKTEVTVKGRRGIQVIAAGISPALQKLKQNSKEGESPTDVDMLALGLSEPEMDAFMRLGEATIVAFLASWSLPDPLPTLDTVGDMRAELFDALGEATKEDGAAVANLSLDTSPGADGTPDPKDHSGPSGRSSGRSRVSKALTPAPK